MRGVGLLVLVLALAAGCSTGGPAGPAGPPGPGDPATSTSTATTPPPLSSTDRPTIGPSGPPKHPSDNLKPIVASGTVRVSPGCVDLVTDSNVIWTLFGVVAKGLQDG